MSKKLKIIKKFREKKFFWEIEILDESIIWKSAEIYFCIECDVKDSRKINSRKRILLKKFIVSYDNKFEIDLKKYEYFTYKWKKISINLSIEIIVDDAIFFDTKVSERLQAQIGSKPGVHSKNIVDKFIKKYKANYTEIDIIMEKYDWNNFDKAFKKFEKFNKIKLTDNKISYGKKK